MPVSNTWYGTDLPLKTEPVTEEENCYLSLNQWRVLAYGNLYFASLGEKWHSQSHIKARNVSKEKTN